MATDWNIMMYLAGDNNLSSEMVWAIDEIIHAGAGKNVVSIHFDPLSPHIPAQRYCWLGQKMTWTRAVQTEYGDPDVKRFRTQVERKGIPVPTKLDLENTGDAMALLYFIWWGLEKAKESNPTYHMLILSGHGAGCDGDFLTDDTSRDSLTIPQLAKALEHASKLFYKRRIDILGLDSCMMSTAEVYFEVSDSVDFLVAAEGFEPDTGWPYHKILRRLGGFPKDVASRIVPNYLKFYASCAKRGGLSTDLSASEIVHLAPRNQNDKPLLTLTKPVRKLGEKLKSALWHPRLRDAIILAHWSAQSYKWDQYVDLFHFASVLRKEISRINIEEAKACRIRRQVWNEEDRRRIQSAIGETEAIMSELQGACGDVLKRQSEVILATGYVGPAFQHSLGLSIYFPWSRVSDQYSKMIFAKETHWAEFLELYVRLTRDPVRITGSPLSLAAFDRGGFIEPHKTGMTPYKTGMTPYKTAITPWKLSQLPYVSMKNPPIAWADCDLLRSSRAAAMAGAKRMKKRKKRP